jgi:hypothetical protein
MEDLGYNAFHDPADNSQRSPRSHRATPPDLVIEVDLSTEARHKFPIYAALGVPELWRYDGDVIQFHLLRNGHYVEASASDALPGLPRDLLIESLNTNKTQGQTAARRFLRQNMHRVR